MNMEREMTKRITPYWKKSVIWKLTPAYGLIRKRTLKNLPQ
jgi:hypothetical protein